MAWNRVPAVATGRHSVALALVACLLLAVPASGHFFDVIQTARDSIGTDYVSSMAVAPDGRHLYATAERTVLVFARDAETGALTFVEGEQAPTFSDGWLASLGVSPDGRHLYVIGPQGVDDRMWIYAIEPDDGTLGLLGTAPAIPPSGTVRFLLPDSAATVTAIAFSPGGEFVYVHGRTVDGAPFPPSDPRGGIGIFQRDSVTGLLTGIGAVPLTSDDPSALVAAPDGENLYAGSLGTLSVLARDASTGVLTVLDELLTNTTALAVEPAGEFVYTADAAADMVRVWARSPSDGRLTLVQTLMDGIAGVDGLDGARSIAVSADGAHLYVGSSDDASVAIFARDPSLGTLSFLAAVSENLTIDGLAGLVHLVFDPSGTHLYVAGRTEGAIVIFDRDAAAGLLSFVATHRESHDGIDGLRIPADALVSPDGAHLYVASPGDASVVVFARDPSGSVTFVQRVRNGVGPITGIAASNGLAMDAGGENLYVGTTTLARDPESGTLTLVDSLEEQPARSLVIAPGDLHAYAMTSDQMIVFSRSAVDGRLSVQQVVGNDVSLPLEVRVSHDGRQVYVLRYGGTITQFDRDALTGLLTFQASHDVPVPSNSSYAYDSSLAISGDGRHAYLSEYCIEPLCPYQTAVAVLDRDGSTGALAFRELAFDTSNGSEYDAPGAVRVSIDGAHVYAATSTGLAVFDRDQGTGSLTWAGVTFAGRNVSGIPLPVRELAVSPDDRAVYAVGGTSAAELVVFGAPCGSLQFKPSLRLKKINLDAASDNDAFVLKGDGYTRGGIFSALDPVSTGMQLEFSDDVGSLLALVPIPGGAFAGSGTTGWKPNAAGTRWLFLNKAAVPLNGIRKISVLDRSARGADRIQIKIVAKNGEYPASEADAGWVTRLDLGVAGECLGRRFVGNQCAFDSSRTSLTCRP